MSTLLSDVLTRRGLCLGIDIDDVDSFDVIVHHDISILSVGKVMALCLSRPTMASFFLNTFGLVAESQFVPFYDIERVSSDSFVDALFAASIATGHSTIDSCFLLAALIQIAPNFCSSTLEPVRDAIRKRHPTGYRPILSVKVPELPWAGYLVSKVT